MKATSRVWAEKQAKSPDPTQGALVVTNLTASTRDRSKLQPWLSVSSPLPQTQTRKGQSVMLASCLVILVIISSV